MARMSGRHFDKRINRLANRRSTRSISAASAPADSTDINAEIVSLAEAAADEHCPTTPIDPAVIAAAKHITLSFGPYGDAFDGMLEFLDGRFHIYCNLDSLIAPDSPRARFTIAHELGHYFIDSHRIALTTGRAQPHGSSCQYESPLLPEQQADLFAANLLMPARRFVAKAKAHPPGLPAILKLADSFATSVTAAALRYVDADLRPCAAIKWDSRGYAWKLLSTSAFRSFFRTTFQSPDALPPDCPTRRALTRQTPPDTGFFQAGTTASAWFPRIEAGQFRDAIFIEQAIPLGRFGTLTFLYPEGPQAGF